MAGLYRGAAPQRDAEGLRIMVRGLTSDNPEMRLWLLDDEILGLVCHWVIDPERKKGRSRLCRWHEGECPYHAERKHWIGFIGAMDMRAGERIVFRMGERSAQAMVDALGTRISPRGMHVLVKMKHGSHTAGAAVTLLPAPDLGTVPSPHDISPIVCAVLGEPSLPGYSIPHNE